MTYTQHDLRFVLNNSIIFSFFGGNKRKNESINDFTVCPIGSLALNLEHNVTNGVSSIFLIALKLPQTPYIHTLPLPQWFY